VSRWLDEPSFWIDHVHPDDREWAKSFCARASDEGRDHAFELRMIAADGRVVWLRDVVRTITEGGRPKENVGVMIDITERRQAEEELRRSRQQLSDLSAHVEWAREEERTVIAREVHDELGQALTALKMDVALLATRLRQDPPAVPDALGRLAAMSELVEDTIHRVRRIAHELRPGVLDDLGLDAAIEWAGQDFEARTGIACRVSSGLGERRLPRELATAFFRIFQEALTNVARHARARGVGVRLEHRGGRLTLEVTDDGRGIAEEAIGGAKSLGLLGMRERARRLGGDVVIAAARGRGTTVSLSVPYEPGPQDQA
jgi:signal transduction histidine kinase